MSLSDQTKTKMQAALDHLKQELKNLRSNRANPGMLDGVMVEVYGSQMKLKELATVTAPEPRQLLVTPFDPQTASAVAKGIERANLNVVPVVEGGMIRITIQPMDESTRKKIAEEARKKGENTKIVIRDIRRKANEQARKEKADGEMTEDVMKKTEKTIQELTDQFCKMTDDVCHAKEKEIMTV